MLRPRVLTLALLLFALQCGVASAQTVAPQDPPLSAERTAAMTPVAEASVGLDATRPSRARTARLSTACRTRQGTDVLVRAYRSLCRIEADTSTAGSRVPTCKSTDRCRARLRRYSDGLTGQAAASRRLNAVLGTAVPDADCRRALRIPRAVLTTLARLRSASGTVLRAIAAGSSARIGMGIQRFYAVDRSPLRDHQGRLDRYRASCL